MGGEIAATKETYGVYFATQLYEIFGSTSKLATARRQRRKAEDLVAELRERETEKISSYGQFGESVYTKRLPRVMSFTSCFTQQVSHRKRPY